MEAFLFFSQYNTVKVSYWTTTLQRPSVFHGHVFKKCWFDLIPVYWQILIRNQTSCIEYFDTWRGDFTVRQVDFRITCMDRQIKNFGKQENTPAGCILPIRKLYMLQFQLPPPDVTGVLGPQMNKFEQVSSDYHKMLLTGDRFPGLMSGCPRSDV